MIKILNLYAGIGGNRKLWGGEIMVTAIENDPQIASIYKEFYPQDEVIITDAHQYLLEHYNEYDFIWSSPPCQSHSRVRLTALTNGISKAKPIFPDMKLYEEILFLQQYYKGKWVVENVIGWYNPLIRPQIINKHYFWSNYTIATIKTKSREHDSGNKVLTKRKGLDISKYKLGMMRERTLLRNCCEPETGLHVLECAFKEKQQRLI